MGGAWKKGEPLKRNLKGWVEFEIYGAMTAEETEKFDKELGLLLQKYGSKTGRVLRRLKLKTEED